MSVANVAELQARYEAACTLTQAVDQTKIVACLRQFFESDTLQVAFLDSMRALDVKAVREAWARRHIPRYQWPAKRTWDQIFTTRVEEAAAMSAWHTREAKAMLARRNETGIACVKRAYADGLGANGEDLSYCAPIVIGAAVLGFAYLFKQWLPVLEAFEAGAFEIYPLAGRVCVATRPDIVRSDEENRLHCADGPAFIWRNMKQYYWHGVRIPAAAIVFPKAITIWQIDREKDRDVRGALWNATRGAWRSTRQRAQPPPTTLRKQPQPIEHLTPEQEAQWPDYVAKWEAIGVSTEPADRRTAEYGIRLTYEAAGLRPPKRIVWTPSPAASFTLYKESYSEIIRPGSRYLGQVVTKDHTVFTTKPSHGRLA